MVEEHLDMIINLHKLGLPFTDIAKVLGLNPNTLHSYCSNHRDIFPKVNSYRRISEEESAQIFKEYMLDGMTQKDIAEKHNVCAHTINRHIIKHISLSRESGR